VQAFIRRGKIMTVDVPLLRKTLEWAYTEWQKHLQGKPSEWNQCNWIGPAREARNNIVLDDDELVAEAVRTGEICGTACCIAGKIVIDDGWSVPSPYYGTGGSVVRKGNRKEHVIDVAAELLGISETNANALFYGSNTIYDLYRIASELTDGEIQIPEGLLVNGEIR
jgi:hypothetical protein